VGRLEVQGGMAGGRLAVVEGAPSKKRTRRSPGW
jgi:hypothetical protein